MWAWKEVLAMPATADRKVLAASILNLSDEDVAAVAAFVRDLQGFDDEPLSDDELSQLAEAQSDIAAGRLIPWDEARQRLEALP